MQKIISNPWTKPYEEVLEYYRVSRENGLSEDEVKDRRETFGQNTVREAEKKSLAEILINQLKSLLVVLLGLAAVVSIALDEIVEGVSILAVLVINTIIGFVTEARALSSMEALREMTKIDSRVRRDGDVKKIPAEDLVPGDIVILQPGDMVPADLRVLESSKLQVDESALTGESVPVGKIENTLEEDTPLAERDNMVYKGTYLTRGNAEGVVVSTGEETELGKISESIREAGEEKTPLEERLDQLAQRLVPLLIAVALIVVISGVFRGRDLLLILETAIALAIATVPEGLPVVATLVLARGMLRMADKNVLINKLSSVETLGSTNIISTDKTGTLTENRMTVTRFELYELSVEVTGKGLETEGNFLVGGEKKEVSGTPMLREALEIGVLCNNASLTDDNGEVEAVGEPMEVSLLIAGRKGGFRRDELTDSMPEVEEVPFDPSSRLMAKYHRINNEYKVAVKGAPEEVLNSCSNILTTNGSRELNSEEEEKWINKSDKMGEEGLRVLGLAVKKTEEIDEKPFEGLTFIGLVGMIDPPREEVKPAIGTCQDAGIKVIMVTGDHASTARNIGYQVGLVDSKDAEVVYGSEIKPYEDLKENERQRFLNASIFARVSPNNKLDLIDLYQRNEAIVAMFGDGVNDAPALKKADIGVAMGMRGTQVAQEASDMILQDDNFSSITYAVEEGRIIFSNIRKFVIYLISCNLSELLTILLASLIGFPLPLLPLQILFLNVVNDVFPAFALGTCRGGRMVMKVSPRDPDESIVDRIHWLEIGWYGALISVVTILAFGLGGRIYATEMSNHRIVTISFLTLAFTQLWHVFNMRELTSDIFRNEITENKYIWGALALSCMILLSAIYIPFISSVLSIEPPDLQGWGLILGMSLVPLVAGQAERQIRGNST
ncbi:HAD-IC family P-type ATPase [Candidatus Bathyarchaeota archaeon]|nr:HAD-IC family P-type ATPase [Candidatus Bathyarchaeota archaeon]